MKMIKINEITTRTIVAKTKNLTLDIDVCLEYFSTRISNAKTDGSLLQIRTGFKNAFTCDIFLQHLKKPVSVKICKNGSFQFTGCITIDDAYITIKYILKILKEIYKENIYYIITIYEVMSNYRIDLKHKIDQFRLLKYFESCSNPEIKAFRSTSCAALNCKYNVSLEKILNRDVFIYTENGLLKNKKYSEAISQKQLEHDSAKEYYVTFLIFESGKVIVSGLDGQIIADICEKFISLMNDFFIDYSIQEEKELKPVNKRINYEKFAVIKIFDSVILKHYILTRGKKHYIASRRNKLKSKYGCAEIIFEDVCKSLDTLKILKQNIKTEQGISCNNVVISVNQQSSQERFVELVSQCNV